MSVRAGRKPALTLWGFRPPGYCGILQGMKVLAILACGLVFVTAASAQRSTLRSGLFGTVMRGPTSPVCAAESPCSAPAAGAVLVFSRGGSDIARVTVAADGSYRLRLRAGTYAVRSGSKRLAPTTARVYVGRMTLLDFSIDTGIR